MSEELRWVDADDWRSTQVVEDIDKDSERNASSSRSHSEAVHESTLALYCELFVHLSEFSIDKIVAESLWTCMRTGCASEMRTLSVENRLTFIRFLTAVLLDHCSPISFGFEVWRSEIYANMGILEGGNHQDKE